MPWEKYGYLLMGGTALTGLLVSCWSFIRTYFYRAIGHLIVTADLQGEVSNAVFRYLSENFTTSPFGPKVYTGERYWLPKLRRTKLVAWEATTTVGTIYWRGWRPMLVRQSIVSHGAHYVVSSTIISTIRGVFDVEKLIVEAIKNEKFTAREARYIVNSRTGSAGTQRITMGGESPNLTSSKPAPVIIGRPINFKLDDIYPPAVADRNGLKRLVLSSVMKDLFHFVKSWLEEEVWYHTHMVPWKMGIRLDGNPGTGKTSFIRAMAEELDLPIYSIALSTCRASDLLNFWKEALGDSPCIVLFEDIDTVYDRRQPLHKDIADFGILLNVIDGAAEADGIITVITTNDPSKLDPALVRAGRIDKNVTVTAPDAGACLLLCERLLGEWPAVISKVAEKLYGTSGAEITRYCSQLAVKLKRSEIGVEEPLPELDIQRSELIAIPVDVYDDCNEGPAFDGEGPPSTGSTSVLKGNRECSFGYDRDSWLKACNTYATLDPKKRANNNAR